MWWLPNHAQVGLFLMLSTTVSCSKPSIGILSVYSAGTLKPYKAEFMDLNLKLRAEYCEHHGYLCLTVDRNIQLDEFRSNHSHLHPNCVTDMKHSNWNKAAGTFNVLMNPSYSHIEWWLVMDLDAIFTDFHRPLEGVLAANNITSNDTLVGCVEWYNPGATRHVMPQPKCTYFYQPSRGRVSLNAGVLLVANTFASKRLLLNFICFNISTATAASTARVLHSKVPPRVYYGSDQRSLMYFLDLQPKCSMRLMTQRVFNSHLHGSTLKTLTRATCSQWRPGDYIAHGAGCGTKDHYCQPLIASLTTLALASRNGTMAELFPKGSYNSNRSMPYCSVPPPIEPVIEVEVDSRLKVQN
eukprot:m.38667 g.38667  ORF g.38667 m.38667 type:complete len:355 (-) comp12607_c0_seq1:17-1081(-)